jgi:hypothetical protein
MLRTALLTAIMAAASTAAAQAQPTTPSLCDELLRHGPEIAQAQLDPKRAVGVAKLGPWVAEPPNVKDDPRVDAAGAELLGIDPDSVIQIEPLGEGAWRASTIAGSGECTTDVFFRLGRDGKAQQLPQAAQYSDLCWLSGREIGRMHGRPVLVETSGVSHPYLGTDIALTPWLPGWGPACRLSIRYRDSFTVSERFCADPALCEAAAALAPTLAKSLARSPRGETLAAVAPPTDGSADTHAARLAAAKGLFDPTVDTSQWTLPTFGQKAKTAYVNYGGTIAATLVDLNGRAYVARVGIGGIGWRDLGDYLVSFYRYGAEGLTPVAGMVVDQSMEGEPLLAVDTPKPQRRN